MPNLRKGFYHAPRKQESKMQQNYEEQKKLQKTIHAEIIPTSQEKPKKQTKSIVHQEIMEFNPSGQISMDQLIKVVLNLQEEVKEFRKKNIKLTELINNELKILRI